MKKIIFSIAGGGLRGVIPACVFVSLEKYLGVPTRQAASFGGGSSTGALLAAAIAAGVPPEDSLGVYVNQGAKIFSPTETVLRDAKLLAQGYRFDNKVLYGIVSATLGAGASMRMQDTPIPLLITGCDQNGDTVYFSTRGKKYGSVRLVDAAVASACATTYHAPLMVPGVGEIADGGCGGVADPCYQVAVEALNSPGCYGDIDPADAVLLSLGTGYYKPAKMPTAPEGLLANIGWVTSALVGSSVSIAEQTVARHWPGLVRVINAPLSRDIDEADVDAIPDLLKIGQDLADGLDWEAILQ